jgi:hypothetical protein
MFYRSQFSLILFSILAVEVLNILPNFLAFYQKSQSVMVAKVSGFNPCDKISDVKVETSKILHQGVIVRARGLAQAKDHGQINQQASHVDRCSG